MVNPWLGIGLVMAVLTALLGGLRLYQRLAAPHPELVRKLLHVGMGLVTLAFPWLFDRDWPVVLLAIVAAVLLLSLRLVKMLKSTVGSVVGGVGRVSLGEVYFPIAVALLFLLYRRENDLDPARNTVLYCVPVLLLTLADAAAALIGISYGRLRYRTSDGEKSAEGSIAFFICAFFCVHVPVLLFTTTDRPETLLIALLLAWLATMFEAVAWAGLDNLVLPLVSFLLLDMYLVMDGAELAARVAVTAMMMVFLALFHRRSTLVGSAVLGAFLVGYISWALGGPLWLLPPVVLFLTYTLLSPRTEINSRQVHNVHAVVCVSSAGLIWLFIASIFDVRPQLLFPYTLAYAAHLAIIGIARLRYDYPTMSAPALVGACILKGWLFIFTPYCLGWGMKAGFDEDLLARALLGLCGVTVAAVVFYAVQPGIHDCPIDTPRWLRQAACAALGSLLALVPLAAA